MAVGYYRIGKPSPLTTKPASGWSLSNFGQGFKSGLNTFSQGLSSGASKFGSLVDTSGNFLASAGKLFAGLGNFSSRYMNLTTGTRNDPVKPNAPPLGGFTSPGVAGLSLSGMMPILLIAGGLIVFVLMMKR